MIPGILNSSNTETLRVPASARLTNFLVVLFPDRNSNEENTKLDRRIKI